MNERACFAFWFRRRGSSFETGVIARASLLASILLCSPFVVPTYSPSYAEPSERTIFIGLGDLLCRIKEKPKAARDGSTQMPPSLANGGAYSARGLQLAARLLLEPR